MRQASPGISVSLVVAALVLGAPCAGAAESRDGAAFCDRSAERFLAQLEKDSFAAATAALHYPPSFTEEERARDQAGIADTLRLWVRELGHPSDGVLSVEPEIEAFTFVLAGTAWYWQSVSGEIYLSVMRTSFRYEGDGYLLVQCIRIHGAWRIRYLGIGLPPSHSNAKRRINNLSAQLIREREAEEE